MDQWDADEGEKDDGIKAKSQKYEENVEMERLRNARTGIVRYSRLSICRESAANDTPRW